MKSGAISKRLAVCGELVRRGAILADVGTDHAYLPIHLLELGKIKGCVLSDINEGPLASARANIAERGFSGMAKFFLTDGAATLSDCGATDYSICGMGGELIAEIICAAPHLCDSSINLILQPMSRPEALRAALFDNGFDILDERYVTDMGKHYVCILASYSGTVRQYTQADIHFGKEEFFSGELSHDMLLYMEERERVLTNVIRGKSKGGESTTEDVRLLECLKTRLKKL